MAIGLSKINSKSACSRSAVHQYLFGRAAVNIMYWSRNELSGVLNMVIIWILDSYRPTFLLKDWYLDLAAAPMERLSLYQ